MPTRAEDRRLKLVVLVLAVASLFCCGLAAARVAYSGRGMFAFLAWNMLLAWAPLALSLLLARRHRPGAERAPGRLLSWTLGALWLAFFPNAPYMVTDLIHLRARNPVPIWFDAVMVFAFALTGVCIAFVSLLLVHRLVERWRGARTGWLFVGAVAALTGFGIYLGRVQRWNSWDLVTRPADLVAGTADHLVHPMSHPRTVGMTALMASLFAVTYLMLFALASLGTVAPARERGPDAAD
jgi:uncharacterized membrane protein